MFNPKDVAAKMATGFHQLIYDLSGGKLLGKVGDMPVLELETTGRKSGKKRTTMLTTPIHDDERVVIVASYGGDDRHPAWFLNLRDNPDVSVTMDGQTRDMTARIATDDERADLWPQVTAKYKGYAGYQDKTDREIPLVILSD